MNLPASFHSPVFPLHRWTLRDCGKQSTTSTPLSLMVDHCRPWTCVQWYNSPSVKCLPPQLALVSIGHLPADGDLQAAIGDHLHVVDDLDHRVTRLFLQVPDQIQYVLEPQSQVLHACSPTTYDLRSRSTAFWSCSGVNVSSRPPPWSGYSWTRVTSTRNQSSVPRSRVTRVAIRSFR